MSLLEVHLHEPTFSLVGSRGTATSRSGDGDGGDDGPVSAVEKLWMLGVVALIVAAGTAVGRLRKRRARDADEDDESRRVSPPGSL